MGMKFVRFEAIDIGTNLDEALDIIAKEFQCNLSESNLIIIDKYSLHVANNVADYYAKTFSEWMAKEKIKTLTVYSYAQKSGYEKFWDILKNEYSKGIACQSKNAIDEIHDRPWLVTRDYQNYTGVWVGTSLNGLGLKLSSANRMSDSDVQAVLKYINKHD